MNNDFIFLDDIFDGLNEAIDELNNGFSSVSRNNNYARVTKNNATSSANTKTTYEQVPFVSRSIQGVMYKNRYEAFSNNVDNIVYPSKYDSEKRNGFETAIKHYKEMLLKNRDFKHLETQIEKDIKECGKNLATNKYLTGYYQGLLTLKNIISQNKKTCFSLFADKFN